MEHADDAELAQRIRTTSSDPSAEAELFRRFGQRIRLYGLRHLRDEAAADDLVQQVIVIVLQALREGRVREPERLASFVLGTSRLLAKDQRRTEHRRQRILDREPPPEAVTPELTSSLDLGRLRSCLEQLPARERAVVVMTFYADQSGDEIARELGMKPGNVRVVRHRAVGHLKDCMGLGAEAMS
jgi:RNA polymerase sigma-70 factor, ECF subfamily